MTLALAFDLQGQIKGKSGVPDIVSKLRQHAYQYDRKGQLASLGRLHNHDLLPVS